MPGVSVRVPEGLRDLMKSFAKEVLRQKPLDIYRFSSQYFESILQAEKDFDFKGYEVRSPYETVFMNGPRREQNQVPLSVACAIIPEELTDLIKEFIKAVLRANPNNICKFAVVYFRRLREQRHKTCSMQYKSYENYLQNMQRGKFAPYARCTCGRVIGEGLPRAIARTGKSVEYQTKKTATEANASRTTNESRSGDANVAKSNFDDEKYIKAVYILQRFFRRSRGKQRPDAQSGDSTTNNKDFQMTAETAAYVIQRTLRKFVVTVAEKSETQHEASTLQIESGSTSETASSAVSSSLPAPMPADATVKIAETEGAGSSSEPIPEKHGLNNAAYLNSNTNQSAIFSETESKYPALSPSVSNNVTEVESSPHTIQHTDIKPSSTDATNQTLSKDISGKPAVAEDITSEKDSSLLESAIIHPGSNSETINHSPPIQSAAHVSTEVASIIDQTSTPQLKVLSTARLQPCQELSAPAAIHMVSDDKVPATSFNNFKTQTETVHNTQPTTNNGSASEIELEYANDSNESNNLPSKQADVENATLKETSSIQSTATSPESDSKTSSHSEFSIHTDSVENAKILDQPHLELDVSASSENTTHLQEGPDFDKTSSYKNLATPDASNFFPDNKIESDAVMKSIKKDTHHGTSEAEAEYQTHTEDISRKRRDTEHITFKRRPSIESTDSYPESDNKVASHSEFIPIINQLSVKESHIVDQSPTKDLELEVSGSTVNTLQFQEDDDLNETRSLQNVSIPATNRLFRNENKDSSVDLNIETQVESSHSSEQNTLKSISEPEEKYQKLSDDISNKSTVAANGTAEKSLLTENKDSAADLNVKIEAESLHGSEQNTLRRISDPEEEYQKLYEDVSNKSTVAANVTAERSLSAENKDSDADLNVKSQAESPRGSEQNTLRRVSDPEEEYQKLYRDISNKSTVAADVTAKRSLSAENKDSDADLNIESHTESSHGSEQNTLKRISDPEEEYQNLSEDISHKSTVAADVTAESSLSAENKDSNADLNIESQTESSHGSEQNTLKRISDPEEEYQKLSEQISKKSTVAADVTAERSLSAENKDSDATLNVKPQAESPRGSEQNTLKRISDPEEEYQKVSEDISHKSTVAADVTAERSLSAENKDSDATLNVKPQAESPRGSEQNTLKRISDPEEEYQKVSEDISHKSTVAADVTAERSLSAANKDSNADLNIESQTERPHGSEQNTMKRVADPGEEYQNLSEDISYKSTVAADVTAERSLSAENKDSDAELNVKTQAESPRGSEQNTLKRISDPEKKNQNLSEDISQKSTVAADVTADRSLSAENKDSNADLNIESQTESFHGSEQNTVKRISDPEEEYQKLSIQISKKSTVAADVTAENKDSDADLSIETEAESPHGSKNKDSAADLYVKTQAESPYGSKQNTLKRISDPEEEYQKLYEDISNKSTVAADVTAERSLSTENKDSDADLNIESQTESPHGSKQNTLKRISDPEEEYQNLSEDMTHKSTVSAIESTEMDNTTVSHSGYAQSTGQILNGDANLVDHNFTTHLKLDPTTAQSLSRPIAKDDRESTTASNIETQVESSHSTIRQLDEDTPLASTLQFHEESDLDETSALQDVSGSPAKNFVSDDKNEYASVPNIKTPVESPLVTKQHILNRISETEEEYQSLSENLSGNPIVTEDMIFERRPFPDSTILSPKSDNKTTSHSETTQSIDEKIIHSSLTSNLELDVSASPVNAAALQKGAYTHDNASQFLTHNKNDSTTASKLSVGTEQSTDNETSETEVEYNKISEDILKESKVPENRTFGNPPSIESTVTSSESDKHSVSSYAPIQSADQVSVEDTKRSTTYLELGVSTPPKDIVQLQKDTELDETKSLHGVFGRDKNESTVALNISTQSESPLRVKRNTLNKTSEIEAEYQNHFENLSKNLTPESTSSLESTVTSPESHNKIASQSESIQRTDQISAQDANLRDESSATHLNSDGSASLSNTFQLQEGTDLEKTTFSNMVPSLQTNNRTASRLGSTQSKEQVPVEDGNPVDKNPENSKPEPSVSDSTDLGTNPATENAKSNPSLVESKVSSLETNKNKIASHSGSTETEGQNEHRVDINAENNDTGLVESESVGLTMGPATINTKSNSSLIESKGSSLEPNNYKITSHLESPQSVDLKLVEDGHRGDKIPENRNIGPSVSGSTDLETEPASENTKLYSSLVASKVPTLETNNYKFSSHLESTQSAEQVPVEDRSSVDKNHKNRNTGPSASESIDLETDPAAENAKSNPSLVESKVSSLETNKNKIASYSGSTETAEQNGRRVDINPENSNTGRAVSDSKDLATDPATANTKSYYSLVGSKVSSLETNNNKISSHLGTTQSAEKVPVEDENPDDINPEKNNTGPSISDSKDLNTDPATANIKTNSSLAESKVPSPETNKNKIASHSGSTKTAEQNEHRVDINPENNNTGPSVSESRDLETDPTAENAKSNSSLVESKGSSPETNNYKITSHLESPQSVDLKSVEDGHRGDKIPENCNTGPSVSGSTDLETDPASENPKSYSSLAASKVPTLETNNYKFSSHLEPTQSAKQVPVEDRSPVDKNHENRNTAPSVSDSTDLEAGPTAENAKSNPSLVESKVSSLETNKNKIASHSRSTETAEQNEHRVDINPKNSNTGLVVSDTKHLTTDPATANTKSYSSLVGSNVSSLEAYKYQISSHLESVDQVSVEDGRRGDKIPENRNTGPSVSESTDLETDQAAANAKSIPSLVESKVSSLETNNNKITSHLGSTQSEEQVGHRLEKNPENRNTGPSVLESTDLERDPATTNTKSSNYVLADNIHSEEIIFSQNEANIFTNERRLSVADKSGEIEDKDFDASSFQVNLRTQDDHDFTVASDDNAAKNVEQLTQRVVGSEANNKVDSEINMADYKIVHNATPVVQVSTTSKALSDAGDKLNDQTRTLQNNLISDESSPMNAIHSTSSVKPVALTETDPIDRVAAETCIATVESSSASGNAIINRSIGTQNSLENHSGTNNSNKVDHSLKKSMKQSKQPSREYCIGIPLEARIAELHLKSFRTSDTSLPWYASIGEDSSAGNNETESRSITKPRVTVNDQTISKSDQLVNYDGSKEGSSNSVSEIDLKRGSHELSKSPLESATQETGDTTPTEGHKNERMPTYLYGIHPPRSSPTESRKVYKKPTAFIVSFGPTPTFNSELEKPEPELNNNEEVESELPHTSSADDSRHLERNEVQMQLDLKPQTTFSDKIGETDLCHSEYNKISNMSHSNATNISEEPCNKSESSPQNSAIDVEHRVDKNAENGTTEPILDPIIELNDGSNNIESTESAESDSDSDSSWSMSKDLDENISQEFIVKNVEPKEKHGRTRGVNETEPHIKGGIYELDRNHLTDVVSADNNNDTDIDSIADQAQNDKENSAAQIENSSRSHTKTPYSPTPPDVQAKEAAATLIQKAFRKYIASRANQDDLRTSANSSWNSSQTTQICNEHDLDKSLEDSSALPNDELNNKQSQPTLVSPTLRKIDHDQEQDEEVEEVEDAKFDWFVGTELIQTSKVEQPNAKLHSNGVEPLDLLATNNAELDKNIHPEMSVDQSATSSAVDDTHIKAPDEYREAFALRIPQSDTEELGSMKKKSQSTGHERAVPVANVESVRDSDTNLTDIVETISTFLGSERTHTSNVINLNNIRKQKDNEISFAKDFFNSSTNLTESNVLYEKLEEDCIKRTFSPTYLVDDDDRSVDVEDEPSSDDTSDTMTNKLRKSNETSNNAQAVDNHAVSSPDREDDKVIVNRLQREDTQREDSAQSDCVVFGGSYEHTPEQLEKGVVEPKILVKSVSYDDNIEYIEPTEFVSSPSLCLDDDTSENIRKQMMAYSLSEADSDAADMNIPEMETKNAVVNLLDSNISSALADMAGTSTETESTVVSATNISRANTGANEAINASMENSIETEAVSTIQRAYRKYQRQKQRPKILADAPSSEQTMNLDSSLASRRMTLQRGNALRNDSAPDEENLVSGNSKGRTKVHDNAKQQVVKSKPPADVTSEHNKKTFDKKLKWLAMRQNSMPVQIDSEVLRVIPKHMRKRIKSADGEKGRRRIVKD